jgi:hypothetical protein
MNVTAYIKVETKLQPRGGNCIREELQDNHVRSQAVQIAVLNDCSDDNNYRAP